MNPQEPRSEGSGSSNQSPPRRLPSVSEVLSSITQSGGCVNVIDPNAVSSSYHHRPQPQPNYTMIGSFPNAPPPSQPPARQPPKGPKAEPKSAARGAPTQVTGKKRGRKKKANTTCGHCSSTSTPEWRRGPNGFRTLCNACGLYYSKLVRKYGEADADVIFAFKKKTNAVNDRIVPTPRQKEQILASLPLDPS